MEHIESETGIYALVNKTPTKKKEVNRDVASLLSPTVRAQLSPEATDQITEWEKEEKKNPGYVQLDFHTENGFQRGRIADEKKPADSSRFDAGKTKYGYSTVVFEKETKTSDKEAASRMRPKKMPPLPPPKYGGQMPKYSSDSQLLYSDISFGATSPTPQQSKSAGGSASDLTHSENATKNTGDESPYVNVRLGGAPVVPPRRGVASPMMDQNPMVPHRKI